MLVALVALVPAAMSTESPDLKVNSGVCGSLHFVTQVGTDERSALAVMNDRLRKGEMGCYSKAVPCRIEPFEIKVADQPARFLGLKVVTADGLLDHGVIDSDGRLYQINWCRD